MPQVLIRDIDAEVLTKLKQRAQRNQRSLEAELRFILQEAVREPAHDIQADISRVRSLFEGRTFEDSAKMIREDREQ